MSLSRYIQPLPSVRLRGGVYDQNMPADNSIVAHSVPYPKPPVDAPNVLIIVLDDIGFGQLGCFGSQINTPHIDSLADAGIRFNRFHVTSICSSTRAALLTGRNHHAVGIGATQETSFALPGYNGRIPKTAAALPRILRDNGYNTMAVGKWHLTPQAEYSATGPFERWPLGMGFERFYGFLGAETNHWAPELVRDNTPVPTPCHTSQNDHYHLTEDLADEAIAMIRNQQQASRDKPFLLWFATGAAHAPHHVSAQWSAPYIGKFDQGWEALRQSTYQRQLSLGTIPPETILTPRPSWIAQWSSLSSGEQKLFARYMEVFAGFVTHADAQIGRLLDHLENSGLADKTIVMLMSDNGASSEGGVTGTLNEAASWLGDHATIDEAMEHIDEIGGPNHTNHYPWGWAWAGNSPFQLWKRYSWLGGVRAPLIVRWPNKILDAGAVRSQFTHAVDLTPTILGAIGLTMPRVVDGITQQKVDGVDASSMLSNGSISEHRHTQYFEMHGSRSMYHDGWKATSNFVSPLFNERAHITGSQAYATDIWQLFDLDADFSESTDLSAQFPDHVTEMENLWIDQATANNVFPLFDPAAGYPTHPGEYPLPRSATYVASQHCIAAGRVPSMFGGFTMSAHITCSASQSGVIAALGDHQGGWALQLQQGVPHFDVVYGHNRCHLAASSALAQGDHVITMTMDKGDLSLAMNDQVVATGRFEAFFIFPGVTTAAGGMWVGQHRGLPVVDNYQCPAVFTGNIESFSIRSGSSNAGPSVATTLRIAEGSD